MNATKERPPLKPRPPCHFYNTEVGCFLGDRCRFLHDGQTSPHEQSKTCRFFAAGYCAHGDKCWYKHVPTQTSTADPAAELDELNCVICYEENPIQYGLLTGCSHRFCLNCIRTWRSQADKEPDMESSGVLKMCPLCRSPSRFVTPSSNFYPDSHPKKQEMIDNYKASMAKIPCRYFCQSKPGRRFCPFGTDCFYQHLDEDGSHHQFKAGVDVMMALYKDQIVGVSYSMRRDQRRERRAARTSQMTVQLLPDTISPGELEAWADTFIDNAEGLEDMLLAFEIAEAVEAAAAAVEAAVAADEFQQEIDAYGPPAPSFLRPASAEADDPMPMRFLQFLQLARESSPTLNAENPSTVGVIDPEQLRSSSNSGRSTPVSEQPDTMSTPPDSASPSTDPDPWSTDDTTPESSSQRNPTPIPSYQPHSFYHLAGGWQPPEISSSGRTPLVARRSMGIGGAQQRSTHHDSDSSEWMRPSKSPPPLASTAAYTIVQSSGPVVPNPIAPSADSAFAATSLISSGSVVATSIASPSITAPASFSTTSSSIPPAVDPLISGRPFSHGDENLNLAVIDNRPSSTSVSVPGSTRAGPRPLPSVPARPRSAGGNASL